MNTEFRGTAVSAVCPHPLFWLPNYEAPTMADHPSVSLTLEVHITPGSYCGALRISLLVLSFGFLYLTDVL